MNDPFFSLTLRNLRNLLPAAAFALHLGAFQSPCHAAGGDVDLSFDPGSGVNGSVQSVRVQPDGKLILSGQFTTVRGLLRTNLARLNADGSGDPTFNAGTNGSGGIIALQPDGKVLISGMFTSICDETWGCFPIESIRRLNADGSLDTGFTPAEIQTGTDLPGCRVLAVQPDGRILVGGQFNGVNGTNRPGLARLHPDGTLDPSFDAPPATVYRLAQQANGDVLVAGGPGGSPFLSRLKSNGQPDTNFNPGASLSGSYVSSLAVQPDGRILLGGFFTSTNASVNGKGAVRLHANGSLDPGFIPPADPNDGVFDLSLQSDGKVLIAGTSYTEVEGPRRQVLVRLQPNGALDSGFVAGDGGIRPAAIVLQSNDQAIVMSVLYGSQAPLVRLTLSGALDPSFNSGRSLGRPTASLALQADGRILVGGPLVRGDPYWGPATDTPPFVNGTNQHGRVRLLANGLRDAGFQSSFFEPALFFNSQDCVPDPRFGCYLGAVTSALLAQPNGSVLVSGYSVATIIGDETFFQTSAPFFARYSAMGVLEQSYSHLSNSFITSIVRQPDGRIVIGGSLNLNGTYGSVARLLPDGTLDSSFPSNQTPDLRFSQSPILLAAQHDGRILVSGTPMYLNGASRVARLSTDGLRDPCFNATVNGPIHALAAQSDGRILVGGRFSSVNGVPRANVARLHPSGSVDAGFDPGTGPDGAVSAIVPQPDGNILIGGDFSAVNGLARPYLARLIGSDAAPALRLVATPTNTLAIGWPASAAGFTLQQSTNLGSAIWADVGVAPVTVGLEKQVVLAPLNSQRYFRLSGSGAGPSTHPVPAPVPAHFTAAIPGDRQITLNWVAFSGALEHRIERANSVDGPYATVARLPSTTYTDTNLVNGRSYLYRISSLYACGESAPSEPIGQVPQAPLPPVYVQDIRMSWVTSSGRHQARAVVKVVTSGGVPVSNVSVSGTFSGAINEGPLFGDTNASGEAPVTSISRIQSGTVTFTVTGINAYGTKVYTPASNVVTSATISR